MQQFKGVIYQAINIQNRKSYIGKTIEDFESYKNWHVKNALENKDLKQNKKGKHFYNAIRKYGPENFKWVVLGEIEYYNLEDLKQKLNEAEIESILLFRTFGLDGKHSDNIYGYNMTKGGDGGDTLSQHPDKEEIYKKSKEGYKKTLKNDPMLSIKKSQSGKKSWETKSEEEKESIRLKHIGEKNGRYKKEVSAETRNKIGDANTGHIPWNKGLTKESNKILKETSEKISKTRKGKYIGTDHPRYIDLNYEFLIINYFTVISVSNILFLYKEKFNFNLTRSTYQRFLDILNFPSNTIGRTHPKEKEIYLKFIEENKDKINFFIDNYNQIEFYYFKNEKEKYE